MSKQQILSDIYESGLDDEEWDEDKEMEQICSETSEKIQAENKRMNENCRKDYKKIKAE